MSKPRTLRRKGAIVIAAAMMALLGGCDTTTPAEHIERARAYIAEHDERAAMIELKNALTKDAQLVDGRLLLGEVSLALGDVPAAEKEFERALDLGAGDEALLGLLRARNRMGNSAAVIGALEERATLSPELATVLGAAYLQSGDTDRARNLFQQNLNSAEANAGLAAISWNEGDIPRAQGYLENAVRIEPRFTQGWLQLGELALDAGDFERARELMETARQLPDGEGAATVGIVRSHLLEGNRESARAEVDALVERFPELPIAQYLKGLTYLQQGELDVAEAAIRQVQSVAPAHLPSLYLMGVIMFERERYNQAADSVERFVAADPQNVTARKLLATIYSRLNDPKGAAAALAPVADAAQDPQLVALYGAALLRSGDPARATQYLERAVELAPDMAAFRNELALSLMSSGETGRAESQLNLAMKTDQDQYQSDYLLAFLRAREGDFEGAAAAADALIRKNADDPLGYQLRGNVAALQGDMAAARQYLQRAVDADAKYLPALFKLAEIEESQGNTTRALELLKSASKLDVPTPAAFVQLAEFAVRQRDIPAAIDHLEAAILKFPDSAEARARLTGLYLATNDLQRAASIIDDAYTLNPDTLQIMLLKAEVEIRSGNTAEAETVATRIQQAVAGGDLNANSELFLRLGDLQFRLGKTALARLNFAKVPDDLRAQAGLARVALTEGDVTSVEQSIAELTRLKAPAGLVELLQGDLLRVQGKADEAMDAYQKLTRTGSREALFRLAGLRAERGEVADAISVVREWLQQNAADPGAKGVLATLLVQAGETAEARATYESLLPTTNPVVLNNLAWMYIDDDIKRAADMARRAAAAAPGMPEISDTLGWILVKQNKTAEALTHLREAARQRPDNASIQFHLGMAQIQDGQTALGKQTLRRALQLNNFPERREAERVLAGS